MAVFQELKARDEQAHRDQLKDTELGLHRVEGGVAEIETNVAKAYIAFGVPQKAEELLERAFQLNPSSPEPARVLAWLFEREGRVDEAVQTLSDVAAALPEDFTVHLALGQLLARIGRVEEAEQNFLRMVDLTPNQASGHVVLARFYLEAAHKPDEAKGAAQRAVDLAPTAENYFLLAEACYGSGDLQHASAAIERAIALEPDRVEYHRLRDAIPRG
jgi:tetratricopeptide (TPR) repeat protein